MLYHHEALVQSVSGTFTNRYTLSALIRIKTRPIAAVPKRLRSKYSYSEGGVEEAPELMNVNKRERITVTHLHILYHPLFQVPLLPSLTWPFLMFSPPPPKNSLVHTLLFYLLNFYNVHWWLLSSVIIAEVKYKISLLNTLSYIAEHHKLWLTSILWWAWHVTVSDAVVVGRFFPAVQSSKVSTLHCLARARWCYLLQQAKERPKYLLVSTV